MSVDDDFAEAFLAATGVDGTGRIELGARTVPLLDAVPAYRVVADAWGWTLADVIDRIGTVGWAPVSATVPDVVQQAVDFLPPLVGVTDRELLEFLVEYAVEMEPDNVRDRETQRLLAPVLDRDGDQCCYCLRPLDRTVTRNPGRSFSLPLFPTPDHVIPHALGARTVLSGLVPACWDCQTTKRQSVVQRGKHVAEPGAPWSPGCRASVAAALDRRASRPGRRVRRAEHDERNPRLPF